MAIRTKLQPTEVSVDNDGTKFNIVTGAKLSLEVRGEGSLPVGSTSEPATIEFFEVKGPSDKSKKPRKIATVQCALFEKGGVPKLDHREGVDLRHVVQHEDFVKASDFFIAIEIASANVENLLTDFMLFLPWEVFEENKLIEVQAVLKVNGSPTTPKMEDNDTLDVRLMHENVPRDGDPSLGRVTAFGIHMVYPDGSDRVVKGGKGKLKLFIHQSVVDLCNAVQPGSFDKDEIDTRLDTIFKDAGFKGVATEVVDDAKAGKHFHNRAPRIGPDDKPVMDDQNNPIIDDIKWSAVNINDPNDLDQDSGEKIPFFEFWVFHDPSVAPEPGDLAQSESINDLQSVGPNKHVLFPIVIAGDVNSPFGSTWASLASDDDRRNTLATVLAHEMAHSFGLRHGLVFKADTQDYVYGDKLPSLIHPRGVMAHAANRNGVSPLKHFGPVHKKVIKQFL